MSLKSQKNPASQGLKPVAAKALKNMLMCGAVFAAVLPILPVVSTSAWSDSIRDAMATAYQHNVTLKAQRAAARAVDEGVPIARSGFLPQISAGGNYSVKKYDGFDEIKTGSFGVQLSQLLFDGFKTSSSLGAAGAQVRATHHTLRNTEQDVLFNSASAYADVIRDGKLVVTRRKNLAFLKEQLRAAKARFRVGEGTRTDVAQAEAKLASEQAQFILAKTNYKNSQAVYRQVIGIEVNKLGGSLSPKTRLPKSLKEAIRIAYAEHPALLASEELVNVYLYNIDIAQSGLYPTLSIVGSAEKGYSRGLSSSSTTGNAASGTITAQLNIPIFQGGRVAAQVRQSKEELREKEIQVEVARAQVRANVVNAWTSLQAANASIIANHAQIKAAKLALKGVIEERSVGQRTILDVLNAQQVVLDAENELIKSERNSVVGKYALLSATGRMTASELKLDVAIYNPKRHSQAVKDKWFGLRTVD